MMGGPLEQKKTFGATKQNKIRKPSKRKEKKKEKKRVGHMK